MKNSKGFSLIEIIIVIGIIGLLSSVVISSLRKARDKAYYTRARMEYRSLA